MYRSDALAVYKEVKQSSHFPSAFRKRRAGVRKQYHNQTEDMEMKKKFKLTDLDCANCAAKMEDAIKKIDGVADANVSFMTQKMTIEADDARFDEIMKEVVAVCKKVEPDCIINM